jgi:hypothetical protein
MMDLLLKKSTINWCESDYYHSSYIAEIYNSLTGIFLCLSPILFYHTYKKDYRFCTYIFYLLDSLKLLFIVGIGTILFHGTLMYVFQLIDELPMLLLCIEYTNVLNTLVKTDTIVYTRQFKFINLHTRLFKYSLCIIISILGFINDTLQVVVFQLSILGFTISIIIKLYKVFMHHNITYNNLLIQKRKLEDAFLYNYKCLNNLIHLKNNIMTLQQYNEDLKYALVISILTGISSIIVWKYDQLQCTNNISGYNRSGYNRYIGHVGISGHAIWHVLTSIALYHVNKILLIFITLYN